jgi:hypothetical protein
MNRKILLIALVCVSFTAMCIAQTGNSEQKKIEGVWLLDSLSVSEISADKTQKPVNYTEMEGLGSYIFKKLDFRAEKSCLLFRETGLHPCGFYDIREGGELLLDCEDILLKYHYQLTEYLVLEGEFTAGTPTGIIVNCYVFMRFKKQSNK